jgi:hypothetical protein
MYFAKGSFGCIERIIMPKRTQVAEAVAKEFKAQGVTEAPKASVFDEMKLAYTSWNMRRLFGSFRRAMKIVLNHVEKLPVEAPKAKKAVTPPKRTVAVDKAPVVEKEEE